MTSFIDVPIPFDEWEQHQKCVECNAALRVVLVKDVKKRPQRTCSPWCAKKQRERGELFRKIQGQ